MMEILRDRGSGGGFTSRRCEFVHPGRKFGTLFRQYGSVTVAHAMRARPTIEVDETDAQRAAAQPTWWVHRKWMEELYDVRSKSVHRGNVAGWARRSENDPFAARKVIHLRA